MPHQSLWLAAKIRTACRPFGRGGKFFNLFQRAIMATITLLRPEPLSFNAIDFDVVDIAGQPWLKSSDIARALGYSRADKVTRLFERNAEEFTANMTGMVEAPTLGHAQGLSTKHRVFSMRGAHLLAMFSRTEVAKAFRKWALDVIEAQAGVLGIPATLYKQALQAETREAKSFALASAGSRAMLLRKAEKAELVETVELMREAVQLRLALGYRATGHGKQ